MPPKKPAGSKASSSGMSSMWAKAKTAAAMSSAVGGASSSSSKKAPGPAALNNKGKSPAAASSSAATSSLPPAQYHPLSQGEGPTESLSNMDPLERAVMSILAINPVGLSLNAFDNDFTQRLRKFNEAVHDAVRNSTSQLDAKMLKVKTRTEKKENEAKAVARPVLALRKTQQKLLAMRNYSDAWDQMKEIRRAEKDAVAAYRAQARPEMEAELNAVQEEREVVEVQLKARINTAEERIRAFRQECITQIHLDHGLPPPPPPPQRQQQQQPQQRPQPQPPRPQPLQPPPPQQSGSADDPNSPPIEIIPSPEFHVPNSVAYYPQAHYHAPQAPHHHTAVGSAVASMMMHTPPALLSRPLVPEAAAHVDPTVPPPALFQTTPAPYTGTFAGQVPMRPLPPAWQPNASSSMPMASPWIGNSGMNNNVQSAAEALMSAASMLLGRTTPFPSSYAPISPAPTPASSQGVYNARAARAASTTPAPPSALKQHSAPAPAPATAVAAAAPSSSSPSKAAGRGSAFAHNSSDSDFDEDDVPLTTPTRTSTKPSNRDDVPGITLSNLPKPNISAADRKRDAAQKEDGAKAGWSRAGNFVRSQAMPALRSSVQRQSCLWVPRERRELRLRQQEEEEEEGGRLAAALSRARAQKPETLPEAPTANNNSAATNSSSSFSGVVAAQKAAQKLRSDAAKKRLFTTEDFKQLFSNCRHGRKEAVVKLLENGCPVDGRDSFGNTPLIVACQNGQARIVKACLRHNANPDAQNKQGNTALHYCVAYGFSALGDYLISKGARDDIKNRAGLTPYEGIGFK
ncbi:hypothetical protein NFJ02_03g103810 [Pycnococcus provasolii]